MNKKTLAAAFVSGFVFAIGLGLSGMTQPAKVLGFLDLFGGQWDPSLGLVMVGAIGVHLPLRRWIRTRPAALPNIDTCGSIGDELSESGPSRKADVQTVSGAGLFGIGWGIAGYCPGPAVVSLVSAAPTVLTFVGTMVAGMLVFQLVFQPGRTGSTARKTAIG
jgi:uncharacterized membrane protein YedE/YeeE